MAPQRKPVLPLAADAEFRGHVVRCDPHVRIAVAERDELGTAEKVGSAVGGPVRPQRRGADALHAAGEVGPVAAGRHEPRGQHYGVQPGTALPVHRHAGNTDRQAGLQRRQPGNIAAGTHRVADHNVRNAGGRQSSGVQQSAKNRGKELVGTQLPERPVHPADGSTKGCDDHRLAVGGERLSQGGGSSGRCCLSSPAATAC